MSKWKTLAFALVMFLLGAAIAQAQCGPGGCGGSGSWNAGRSGRFLGGGFFHRGGGCSGESGCSGSGGSAGYSGGSAGESGGSSGGRRRLGLFHRHGGSAGESGGSAGNYGSAGGNGSAGGYGSAGGQHNTVVRNDCNCCANCTGQPGCSCGCANCNCDSAKPKQGTAPAETPAAEHKQGSAAPSDKGANMLDALNRYRAKYGLAPMQRDPILQQVAERRVGAGSHVINGVWVWQAAHQAGFPGEASITTVTDNVALGYKSADDCIQGWSTSDGHARQMRGESKMDGRFADRHFNVCGLARSGGKWLAVFGRKG